jgi:preprotein translocase subunit SecA
LTKRCLRHLTPQLTCCNREASLCTQARAVEEAQPGLMQEAQRFFLLTQIDNLWKEHLQSMQFLRQAVGLRGYGQRDPLTEYKLEGFELFKEMLARVRRNVIFNVYVFQPTRLSPADGVQSRNGAANAAATAEKGEDKKKAEKKGEKFSSRKKKSAKVPAKA